jgi:ribosomal protein L20
MSSLGQNQIGLNRKVLSELAANEPFAFKSVVDVLDQQQQRI